MINLRAEPSLARNFRMQPTVGCDQPTLAPLKARIFRTQPTVGCDQPTAAAQLCILRILSPFKLYLSLGIKRTLLDFCRRLAAVRNKEKRQLLKILKRSIDQIINFFSFNSCSILDISYIHLGFILLDHE